MPVSVATWAGVWRTFVLCCLLVPKLQVLLSELVVAGRRVSFMSPPHSTFVCCSAPNQHEGVRCCQGQEKHSS